MEYCQPRALEIVGSSPIVPTNIICVRQYWPRALAGGAGQGGRGKNAGVRQNCREAVALQDWARLGPQRGDIGMRAPRAGFAAVWPPRPILAQGTKALHRVGAPLGAHGLSCAKMPGKAALPPPPAQR